MNITLTDIDFQKLSPEAQKEIIGLVYSNPKPDFQHRLTTKFYDLSFDEAQELLNRVSQKSCDVLELFAKKKRVSAQEMCVVTGKSIPRQLSGIQSGITKAIRNITAILDIYLLKYDNHSTVYDSAGGWVDGIWEVSDKTQKSLAEAIRVTFDPNSVGKIVSP